MARRFGKEVRIDGHLLGYVRLQESSSTEASAMAGGILDKVERLIPALRRLGGFLPTLAEGLERELEETFETFAQLKRAFVSILREIFTEVERQIQVVPNCRSLPELLRSVEELQVVLDRIPDSHDDENTVLTVTISYLLPKTAVDEVVTGITSLVGRQEAQHAASALLRYGLKAAAGEFLVVGDEQASEVFHTGVKVSEELTKTLTESGCLVSLEDLDMPLSLDDFDDYKSDSPGGDPRSPDSPSTDVDSGIFSPLDVDWTDSEIPSTTIGESENLSSEDSPIN
jgi:hypothetical protein